MLPAPVSDDLFNLKSRSLHDMTLLFFEDELSDYHFKILHIGNYDTAIYFDISRSDKVEGELRIDKFTKKFTFAYYSQDNVLLPITGDWDKIVEYLKLLN